MAEMPRQHIPIKATKLRLQELVLVVLENF